MIFEKAHVEYIFRKYSQVFFQVAVKFLIKKFKILLMKAVLIEVLVYKSASYLAIHSEFEFVVQTESLSSLNKRQFLWCSGVYNTVNILTIKSWFCIYINNITVKNQIHCILGNTVKTDTKTRQAQQKSTQRPRTRLQPARETDENTHTSHRPQYSKTLIADYRTLNPKP